MFLALIVTVTPGSAPPDPSVTIPSVVPDRFAQRRSMAVNTRIQATKTVERVLSSIGKPEKYGVLLYHRRLIAPPPRLKGAGHTSRTGNYQRKRAVSWTMRA